MNTITGGGAFTTKNISDINANFLLANLPFTPGRVIWLNPASSNVTQPQDGSQAKPYTTLSAAYSATRNAMNDVILLVGNGASSGTARVDAAFTWGNDATHLIGYCSPTLYSQRARIAPTATTTAFTPFFTVSGNGCMFQNIQWFHGFNTGTTSQINMVVTGTRNVFTFCAIDGLGDATSAGSAGSRSLKLNGGGENVFNYCSIGIDTGTKRTNANASLEFAGATVRNYFLKCKFPMWAASNAEFFVLGTGADCVDRDQTFDQCLFINQISSGATTVTAAMSLTNAAPGGLFYLKDCAIVGATKWGDTNALANSYLDMAAPSGSAGGLGVNPS